MANTDPFAPFLHSAVAEEMRHVRAMLEQMAEVLASDEHVATLYLDQLQAFDLVIQCTDETAAVLDRMARGVQSQDAITPVRLEAVQGRLRAALEQAA